MKNIVILGAGTGGTILANTLTRKLDMRQWAITVIDKASEHYYQPGFLFLPFKLYGYENKEDVFHPITKHLPSEAKYVQDEVKLIDHKNKKVETANGKYDYDWLILAMGCEVRPEEVEGMAEGMGKNVFTFYTPEGAMALQEKLDGMDEGRLVLNIAEMPIKCPVAPIEFVFLADYFFHLRKSRERVEIDLVTPLTGAFTKPLASHALDKIAQEKNIKTWPNFQIASVDHENKNISSFGGESVPYDVLVAIPPHFGPQSIEDSGLGNGLGYAVTDDKTLKSKKAEHIYAIGDNTNVPTSKAGSVAHFEAEIIETNLLREIEGKEPIADFDGHSNCFIESGFHKALLFDFNYTTEPLPGVYPLAGVGPMALLKETRLNHWGKMAFKYIYWNLLLSGHMPGDPLLPSHMSFSGKDVSLIKRKDGHKG